MSVADTIQELATDIGNAYDEVQTKGGTLPQNKNTNNLATAIATIPTGITPTGTLNITQNGTYDVTNCASAAVAVAGVRTVTLTKTLSANANDITFYHTEGEAPKAVILRSTNETHINGEIYYANCIGRGGMGECKNLATGNVSQAHYVSGSSGIYNRVNMTSTSVYFNRLISNSMFPADVPYELTMYFWGG